MTDLSHAVGLLLTEERALAAALIWEEDEHPRDPAGTSTGGRFVEKGDPHVLDDNPDENEMRRIWNDLYGRSVSWELNEMTNPPKPPWAGPRFGPGQVYHDAQFTSDQHQAMEHYQGSGYASVNHLLRDEADFDARIRDNASPDNIVWNMLQAYGTTPEEIKKNVWLQINDLDNSLRPNPRAVTAYRINQIEPGSPQTLEAVTDVYGNLDASIVGKRVVDPGFQSTTLDKAWADKRTGGGRSQTILHRIRVPAGVPAIYMPSAHPSLSFDEEQELTLGRDTPMRAVGYEELMDGTKIVDWVVEGW